MRTVVVTRHPALVKYLREVGLVEPGTEVIGHATPEDVAGKHVFGVLPMHLASLAECVTEVQLNVPPELRGVELTLEQVREYAVRPRTYRVKEIGTMVPADSPLVQGVRGLAYGA